MIEVPQITGLGQDGKRVDRTNARNVAQQLVVDVIGEPFDLVTLVDEAAPLRDDRAEHGDGGRVLRDRQRCRGGRRLVDVVDEA